MMTLTRRKFSCILIIIAISIAGCTPDSEPTIAPEIPSISPSETAGKPTQTVTFTASPIPTGSRLPVFSSTATPLVLPDQLNFLADDWMNWPILPIITQDMKEIYELGQALGRNANAFSIFGDCQSTPDEFLGLYELDDESYAQLSSSLQETVNYFDGSLNHDSPTVKSGTTTGALLWEEWHEGKYGCQLGETPVECELRTNNPAFVIISVGTHYEKRNAFYLEIIIEDLLSRGVIPILSTKADNREGDHRINLQTAELAVKYNLPLWNFWAATSHLPDNGLVAQEGNDFLGKIYFNDEVKDIHRLTALQTLDKVWRTLENSN